jgi:DNA-binding transcriptional LysR family regulator
MDFRHIRAFLAVADALSVTRAAERLHISQPPLTRHIHQLEHELGLTLFIRHRHGVTLTDAGRWLLDKARTLEAAATDFYTTASELATGASTRIRIGIGWGLWDALNSVRVEFGREHPDATIEVRDLQCAHASSESLRTRTLDLAFGRPPFDTDAVEVLRLYAERVQVAISTDHPLASRPSLSIRDLAQEALLTWDRDVSPVLFDLITTLYERAGIVPRRVATPGIGPFNLAGLMQVASGRGVYLCLGVPHTGPHPTAGVAERPLSDPGATIDVCLASRKGEQSAVVRQFVETAARVFAPADAAVAQLVAR